MNLLQRLATALAFVLTACLPSLSCSGSKAPSTGTAALPGTLGSGEVSDEADGLLARTTSFLLGRELTQQERKRYFEALNARQAADPLGALTEWHTLQYLDRCLTITRGPGERHALRNRTVSRIYFQAAALHNKDSFPEVLPLVDASATPLAHWVLHAHPVVLEDHVQKVIVTDPNLANIKAAYPFFAEVCGASDKEVAEAMAKDRAETSANFHKEGIDRTFFGMVDAHITGQKHYWNLASAEKRAALKKTAKARYAEKGFWYVHPLLNEFVTEARHAELIAPTNRLVDAESAYLTKGEVQWALDLITVVLDDAPNPVWQEKFTAQMIADFRADPAAYNERLTSIDRVRSEFIEQFSLCLKADYRLYAARALWAKEAAKGEVPNLLHQLDAPGDTYLEGEPGYRIGPWQANTSVQWGQLVAGLAGAKAPDSADQSEYFRKRFSEDPSAQRFLWAYPLFLEDALIGWQAASPTERDSLKAHCRQIYGETKSLAAASEPLALMSLAARQQRIKGGLDSMQLEILKMQGQQMLMNAMIQSNAIVTNAMSEAGAIAGAGVDDDILYGGPGNLMINGDTHIYPVPQANLIGQYAIMESLTGMGLAVMTDAKNKAAEGMQYLEKEKSLVHAGALKP